MISNHVFFIYLSIFSLLPTTAYRENRVSNQSMVDLVFIFFICIILIVFLSVFYSHLRITFIFKNLGCSPASNVTRQYEQVMKNLRFQKKRLKAITHLSFTSSFNVWSGQSHIISKLELLNTFQMEFPTVCNILFQ